MFFKVPKKQIDDSHIDAFVGIAVSEPLCFFFLLVAVYLCEFFVSVSIVNHFLSIVSYVE